MSTDIVIVAAARTGVGKFGGTLAKTPAADLGAAVIAALLERAKLSGDQISEVILGQVLQAGAGQNPARQAVVKSGLPHGVPAMTINKVCGSGLKAVMLATQAIRDGDAEIVIAGGQESMSLSPHVLPGSRDGVRMGDWKLQDTMIVDGLWDVYNKYHMGITAENVAKKYGIGREEQDALALASQRKAVAAQDAGRFTEEIIPFSIPQRKGDPVVFATDEYVNRKTSAEALAGLKPAFDKAGSVTAGNASGLNDGAAGVVVMTAKKADQVGLQPLARIASYASAALDPAYMGMGPVPASQRALQRAGWKPADLVVAVADRLRGQHHRLQAGAADRVDGQRRHALRQAALDDGLARRVLPAARGQDLAEDHLADLVAAQLGALEQVRDDGCAELGRWGLGKRSAEFADGGPGGGDDDDVGHVNLQG